MSSRTISGKLTAYADYSYKVEPNEDSGRNFGNQQTATSTYFPYTRPFLFPNYARRTWRR